MFYKEKKIMEILEQEYKTKLRGKKTLTFSTRFEYIEKDKGYLGKCPELDVVIFASSLEEAKEELVGGVIETSDVLLEVSKKDDS
jgi:hypothetical protein